MLLDVAAQKSAEAQARNNLNKHAGLVESFTSWEAPAELATGKGGKQNLFEPMLIADKVNAVKELHPFKQVRAALMFENFIKESRTWAGKLNETSRANMPQWIRNGLAMISTSFAENIADQVISEQPMASRAAKVHYLDIQTEVQKGNIAANTRLFNALSGFRGTQDFSSEKVVSELVGASGTDTYGVGSPLILGWRPIVPGTVFITDGVLRITDDRNGNLVGNITTGSGVTNTINYLTGQINFKFSSTTVASVTCSYQYNIEAALQLPEFGIQLRQDMVEARDRAVGASWTQQALFDFMNDFGIDCEPTILDAGRRIMDMEKFKHIVNTLRNAATGGTMIFNNVPPSNVVPYPLHIKTFSYFVSRLQNLIWERTQTVRPNVLVVAPDIWFMVAAQDGFEGEAVTANDGVAGPRKIGTLTRHGITVFADPTYPRSEGVLTYRGPEFVSTAAILANYVPFYQAPVHIRAFRRDVAMLTSYAIHVVDPNMIGIVRVINL